MQRCGEGAGSARMEGEGRVACEGWGWIGTEGIGRAGGGLEGGPLDRRYREDSKLWKLPPG